LPNPGQPCKAAPRCGDGVVQTSLGEVCDDGNQADGDGCSADCKTKGAGCVCTPGKLCTCRSEVRQRHPRRQREVRRRQHRQRRRLLGDCKTVEKGFQCRVVGKPCTPKCGDGIKSGAETCDDGNTVSGDGCSATCHLELGYKCDDNGKCTSTTCGDGKVEGAEGCDDGNNLPFDGCSIDCQWEPDCSGSSCTSKCGDGIVLNEDCDDGNAGSGDGCSKDCKVEPGWTCKQPDLGDKMLVPALYRDFKFSKDITPNGNDFENGVTGSAAASPGMVNPDLGSDGEPVYANPASPGGAVHVQSSSSFATWWHNTSGVNHATSGKLTLWKNDQGAYVNRHDPNGAQWYNTEPAYYCGNVGAELTDASGNPIPCTSKYGSTDCDTKTAAGLTMLPNSCTTSNGSYTARFIDSAVDGDPLFFPVDGDNFSAADATYAQVPPLYDPRGPGPRTWMPPGTSSCTTSASPARCATGSSTTRPRATRSISSVTTTSGSSSTRSWPSTSAASTCRSRTR
jgi:cysteine-rich repeat protein